MYGTLLEALAAEIETGTIVRTVLAGHENDSGPSALGLRLLGSLHRLVLSGRAPELEPYYPSVGGSWDEAAGPAAVLAHLEANVEQVREWLGRPPQTNEVGRSAALMGALLHLPDELRLPVQLHEIGSSGGLNLLLDGFRFVDEGGAGHGPVPSPVVIAPAWSGDSSIRPWPAFTVRERRGCDILPVPSATPEGGLRLMSYVWPDQPIRLERLRGALSLAAATPPDVQQCGAADFIEGIDLAAGRLTVIWHSVMWQYLDAAEQQRASDAIADLGARATARAPLAHIRLEPARRTPEGPHEFLVQVTTWPGGQHRVLGTAHPHGAPITWDTPTDA